MAQKVVSVKLEARTEGFVSGMKKARSAADDLTKSSAKFDKQDAFGNMANKAAIAGLGVATAVGVAVKRFADFDASMSAVQASTGATGSSMDALRDAAIEMGAASQFSAKEAADGINELAKAGVATEDILNGGLKGALDLAAAGQIGVAQAAETTASALNQFGLEGSKAGHVADLLSNAANAAQGGVGDMGAALAQAGVAANAAGLNIDETTTTLALFAKAGLVGSDAGTSLKTMMQRLSAPTEKAALVMEDLGIAAYNSSGEFIGAEALMGQLATATADMSTEARMAAFNVIFGADAIRAASIASEAGAAGYASMNAEVTKFGGASKMAAALTDNLKGDVERLGGALDSAFIQTGSGANGSLRSLTQGLTSLVQQVAKVPGPLLLAGGALSALALLGPKGVMAYRAYTKQLDSLGLSMDKIAARGPRAAKGVNAVTAAAKGFAVAAVAATTTYAIFDDEIGGVGPERLAESIRKSGSVLEGFNAQLAATSELSGRFDSGVSDFSTVIQSAFDPSKMESVDKTLGTIKGFFGGTDVSNIAIANQRLAEFDTLLAGLDPKTASSYFDEAARAAAPFGVTVEELKAKLPQFAEGLAATGNAAAGVVRPVGEVSENLAKIEESAEDAAEALDNVKSAITSLGGGLRAEQQAIADSNEALKEAQELATNSKATRAEDEASLRGLSASYLEVSAAQVEMGRGAGEVGATMKTNREDFIKTAVAMGYNATFAAQLADKYGLIPDKVSTLVEAIGAETSAEQVKNLNTVILGLNGKTVTVKEAGKAKPSKDNVLELDGAIFGLKDKTVKVQELGSTASGERVVKFNGKIYTLKGKTVTVTETGATAAGGRVDTLATKIARLQGKRINIGVNTNYTSTGSRSTAGGITKDAATGGAIYGPGTGTSDSIPARLSNGEHVLTAAEVRKLGGQSAVYALRAAINRGNLPKYATGGAVTSSRFARPAQSFSAPSMNVTTVDLSTVQQAVAGMSVVMDGQKVGKLVAAHQQEYAANGPSRR